MDSMIGRMLGRYQVDSKIGQGGMGMVYRAMQASLNRTVAIKVLPAQLAMDSEFVERFRQEALTIASLQHEAIVHVYDIDRETLPGGESLYFIVMEFVDGETLRAVAARHRPLPVEQVRSIGIALARALEYAHGRGIVHRDIKTANVMITRGGQVKLMDFGIAKAAGGVKTMTGSVLGTPEYMAPEQARTGKVSPQSDLYSLGVLLYELAVGQMPFVADDPFAVAIKHLTAPTPRAREAAAHIPLWLDAVIYRLMAKEPAERYGSAAELLADLKNESFTPSALTPRSQEQIATIATPPGGSAPLGPPAPTWPPPPPAPTWVNAPTAVQPGPTPPGHLPPHAPAPPSTWPGAPYPPAPPTPPASAAWGGAQPPPYAGATPPAGPWNAPGGWGGPATPPASGYGPPPSGAYPGPGGYVPQTGPPPGWPPPSPTGPATAFDVPKGGGGKTLVVALFALALLLGVAGGAWWIRRDRTEVAKPPLATPGPALPAPQRPNGPSETPVAKPEPTGQVATKVAPPVDVPVKVAPRPTRPVEPPPAAPAYQPTPAPPADEPAPAEPALPSAAALWADAVRHKDREDYHSLRQTLDQLLATEPQHGQAREWRRKADGWVKSRNDDLREELEDHLDSLADAVGENELSEVADLWGGAIDGQTQAFFVALWRDYRKPKLSYRVLDGTPWDHTIRFEVRLYFEDRDKKRLERTWRGTLTDDGAGVRFSSPLG